MGTNGCGPRADEIPDLAPWSAMGVRAVFLVGFMASGKSSVGQELARRLGWDFVDMDARIESRERQTIPEIFRERGEPGFRLAETSALRDLLTEPLETRQRGRARRRGFRTGKEPRIAAAVAIGFPGSAAIRTLAAEPDGWRGTAAARGSRAVRPTVRGTPSLLSPGEPGGGNRGKAVDFHLRGNRRCVAT